MRIRWLSVVCLTSFAGVSWPARAQIKSGTRTSVTSPQEQALHNLLVKAKTETDAKNYGAAQADYEKYLQQKPDDAAAHFDLGYVFTAQQQTDKAIDEYRKAIALDPKMIEAHLNLGMSLLAEDPRQAIDPLEKVVELNYSFERGHFALGIAEEQSGDQPDAEKEFTIATKLDPDDSDAHSALGRLFLNERKGPNAESEFREVLRLKPNDSDAELGLSRSLVLQSKTEAAVAVLEDYLKTAPHDRSARLLDASLLAHLGKNDEALTALDEAARTGPEGLDALKLRSEIYFAEKDWPKTKNALQKAERIAPRDAVVHARLGHVLLQTRDYASAARELAESVQLDASSNDTLRDLISAEYMAKDFQGSLAALDLLAKREPPDAHAWFVRGSCYDHLNQPKAALEAYEKFLGMNTDQNSDQYFIAAARARFLQKLLKQKGQLK